MKIHQKTLAKVLQNYQKNKGFNIFTPDLIKKLESLNKNSKDKFISLSDDIFKLSLEVLKNKNENKLLKNVFLDIFTDENSKANFDQFISHISIKNIYQLQLILDAVCSNNSLVNNQLISKNLQELDTINDAFNWYSEHINLSSIDLHKQSLSEKTFYKYIISNPNQLDTIKEHRESIQQAIQWVISANFDDLNNNLLSDFIESLFKDPKNIEDHKLSLKQANKENASLYSNSHNNKSEDDKAHAMHEAKLQKSIFSTEFFPKLENSSLSNDCKILISHKYREILNSSEFNENISHLFNFIATSEINIDEDTLDKLIEKVKINVAYLNILMEINTLDREVNTKSKTATLLTNDTIAKVTTISQENIKSLSNLARQFQANSLLNSIFTNSNLLNENFNSHIELISFLNTNGVFSNHKDELQLIENIIKINNPIELKAQIIQSLFNAKLLNDKSIHTLFNSDEKDLSGILFQIKKIVINSDSEDSIRYILQNLNKMYQRDLSDAQNNHIVKDYLLEADRLEKFVQFILSNSIQAEQAEKIINLLDKCKNLFDGEHGNDNFIILLHNLIKVDNEDFDAWKDLIETLIEFKSFNADRFYKLFINFKFEDEDSDRDDLACYHALKKKNLLTETVYNAIANNPSQQKFIAEINTLSESELLSESNLKKLLDNNSFIIEAIDILKKNNIINNENRAQIYENLFNSEKSIISKVIINLNKIEQFNQIIFDELQNSIPLQEALNTFFTTLENDIYKKSLYEYVNNLNIDTGQKIQFINLLNSEINSNDTDKSYNYYNYNILDTVENIVKLLSTTDSSNISNIISFILDSYNHSIEVEQNPYSRSRTTQQIKLSDISSYLNKIFSLFCSRGNEQHLTLNTINQRITEEKGVLIDIILSGSDLSLANLYKNLKAIKDLLFPSLFINNTNNNKQFFDIIKYSKNNNIPLSDLSKKISDINDIIYHKNDYKLITKQINIANLIAPDLNKGKSLDDIIQNIDKIKSLLPENISAENFAKIINQQLEDNHSLEDILKNITNLKKLLPETNFNQLINNPLDFNTKLSTLNKIHNDIIDATVKACDYMVEKGTQNSSKYKALEYFKSDINNNNICKNLLTLERITSHKRNFWSLRSSGEANTFLEIKNDLNAIRRQISPLNIKINDQNDNITSKTPELTFNNYYIAHKNDIDKMQTRQI
ncbi:hypothetical protein L3V83_07530 [Thiotrichales bacterium 19X7-9]|nr:hypothetical protein [Thiotrichales bacterium 19X7-9]